MPTLDLSFDEYELVKWYVARGLTNYPPPNDDVELSLAAILSLKHDSHLGYLAEYDVKNDDDGYHDDYT
jgi:hypothetical protein